MTDMLDAALALAAQGIPVFPCGPDKAPRVAGGFHSASTDHDTVVKLDWNNALIGAAITDGLIVVDIDPRNGGDETMTLFEKLPATRKVNTMSGGTHLYFSVPEGVALRPTLGPGVDIKRPGKGYVIVPPSAGYKLVRRIDPAPAPDWLLEELYVDATESQHEAHDPKYNRFEDGTAYGMAALQRQLGRLVVAEHGGRNDALNRAAFSLAQLAAGGELNWEYAAEQLVTTAERMGLEDDEIAKTIESGRSAGEQEPWQAPDTERVDDRLAKSDPLPRSPIDEESFWVEWDIDEPDFPYFVHPILPKHAYVLVFGATAASKSMAWVGILSEASHHGVKTSVYSLENPPATDRQRVRRWRPARDNFRITNQYLDVADMRQVEAMVERERAWGTDVIMIDTYSHAFTSRSDDGNAKAIAFAQVMRHIMAEVDCSVVVIDHTGYAHDDEPRDASAKRQQVDVAILMKQAGEWRPGQPARFVMDNKKATRFGNPFHLNGEIRDEMVDDFKALTLSWIGEAPKWL